MFRKMLLIILALFGLVQGGPAKPSEIHPIKNRDAPGILYGDIVIGREYPGLASMQYGTHHEFAGCILNSEWILTAASGMEHGIDDLWAAVGYNSLEEVGRVYMITEAIVHEDYNISNSYINDIALLKLSRPIQFGEGLTPVALPEAGEVTPPGVEGTTAGWGAIRLSGKFANNLHKTGMHVILQTLCQDIYANLGMKIYPTQICAEPNMDGTGPTFGDEGDPLVIDGKVVGLTTWNRNQNMEAYPVVYTKVADYIGWINDHINA